MDLDDGVAGVVLAAEELLQLERVEACDTSSTLPRSSPNPGIALLRQLEVHLGSSALALALPPAMVA
jgi:hypothetical protein